MYNNLRKWWQTIKVSWAKYTVYRVDFFLQMVGPSLVFLFIKYNLWKSIYAGDMALSIQGYNFSQMIEYHVWTLVVALVGQGYASMNLSEDIRMGRISTYLIYPFNFWEFHTAGWLSFQLLQIVIASVTLTILIFFGFLSMPAMQALGMGMIFCGVVSLYWFVIQYFTGLLSFWLEETWILRVTLNIITAFLSGAFIPLDLYPKWLVQALDYTPFPYLTYYPIKVFTGDMALGFTSLGILLGWTSFFALLNHFTWKKGVKLYTAAGM